MQAPLERYSGVSAMMKWRASARADAGWGVELWESQTLQRNLSVMQLLSALTNCRDVSLGWLDT